jgi:hypothetical protein
LATSSLPVPVSPTSRTEALDAATRRPEIMVALNERARALAPHDGEKETTR